MNKIKQPVLAARMTNAKKKNKQTQTKGDEINQPNCAPLLVTARVGRAKKKGETKLLEEVIGSVVRKWYFTVEGRTRRPSADSAPFRKT